MKKQLTDEQLQKAYCHLSKVINEYLAIYREFQGADLEPTLERLSDALTELEKTMTARGLDIGSISCP
ncbi:hypothetical protein ACPV33_23915 [Vibrio harveyi]|uniref:hypothetical protein n=1 Tax=Vibrio harveyi group TaxID=717610 RepID=UPI0015F4C02F|nr:hypothetical protein [Vibrio rotiferianus]